MCRSLLVAASVALAVVGVAVPAVAQTTILIGENEFGEVVTYSAPQDAFRIYRASIEKIQVSVTDPAQTTSLAFLEFTSPDGVLPAAGGHYLSPSTPPGALTALRYAVPADSPRNCFYSTGRFLIRELTYAADATVERLAVDIEAHCTDAPQASFGVLRYNSTVPTDRFPGETVSYSLTIAPPAHGVITGSGFSCGSGHAVCTMTFANPASVSLTAIPEAGYIFTGWTGGCGGGTTMAVHVNSIKTCGAAFATVVPTQPRTLLIVNGAQGDPISHGRSYAYSAANGRWLTRHGDIGNGEEIALIVEGLDVIQAPESVFRPGAPLIFQAEWSATFRSARGTRLAVGRYAADSQFSNPFQTAFVVGGTSSSPCGSATTVGEFVIYQMEFNADGSLRAFAADFKQNCRDGLTLQPGLRGTVLYNSSLPLGTCTTPDPFESLGGGTCYSGGWLPPGMPLPSTGVTPLPPPPPAGCTTPDPFATLGGGTCVNGGWLPPGMPVPGGGSNPPPPPPPTGCTTPDPFISLGGGTCRNGGWLPPGMH